MKIGPVVVSSAISAVVSVAATLYFVNYNGGNVNQKPAGTPTFPPEKEYDSEIVEEQQARTRAFLKSEGMAKLKNCTVAVVGAGGVGSYVVTMLVRSGIGKVIIVDFDQVSLSSLNRHACATLADVGTPKVTCLAEYCKAVAPWIEVVPYNQLWNAENGPALLEGADYVVDCIDNIPTKVDLLAHCVQNKMKVISSMGAGAKADPTRIMVGDISQTYEDPMSRSVRVMLRTKNISTGIPTVYSTEKPGKDKARLLDIAEEQLETGAVDELSVLKDFRVRIMPVLGPLPAMFGLTLASHVLCDVGGYTSVFDPIKGGYSLAGKQRTKLYENMLGSINGQFMRLNLDKKTTHVSVEEIEYLIEEVWRGKTLSGEFIRQKLTLWDPNGEYTVHNMVPVTRDMQEMHEKLVLKEKRPLNEVYTTEQLAEVEKRFALDRWYMQFRVN